MPTSIMYSVLDHWLIADGKGENDPTSRQSHFGMSVEPEDPIGTATTCMAEARSQQMRDLLFGFGIDLQDDRIIITACGDGDRRWQCPETVTDVLHHGRALANMVCKWYDHLDSEQWRRIGRTVGLQSDGCVDESGTYLVTLFDCVLEYLRGNDA